MPWDVTGFPAFARLSDIPLCGQTAFAHGPLRGSWLQPDGAAADGPGSRQADRGRAAENEGLLRLLV